MNTQSRLVASSEGYRYSRGGARSSKTSWQSVRQSPQHQQVRYLAGLELRTQHTGSVQTENMRIIALVSGEVLQHVLPRQRKKSTGPTLPQLRYRCQNRTSGNQLELDAAGKILSREEYYPFGGTAVWATQQQVDASFKTIRYAGKERDATGLYYYGFRYYAPWLMRWSSTDPAGNVDGTNLYRMVRNNPQTWQDSNGLMADDHTASGAAASAKISPHQGKFKTVVSLLGKDKGEIVMPGKKIPFTRDSLYLVKASGEFVECLKASWLMVREWPNVQEKRKYRVVNAFLKSFFVEPLKSDFAPVHYKYVSGKEPQPATGVVPVSTTVIPTTETDSPASTSQSDAARTGTIPKRRRQAPAAGPVEAATTAMAELAIESPGFNRRCESPLLQRQRTYAHDNQLEILDLKIAAIMAGVKSYNVSNFSKESQKEIEEFLQTSMPRNLHAIDLPNWLSVGDGRGKYRLVYTITDNTPYLIGVFNSHGAKKTMVRWRQ